MANLSRKSGQLLLFFCATTLLLASCTDSVAPTYVGTPIRIIDPKTVVDLEDIFIRFSYDMKRLNAGVPPIIFESLPAEISDVNSLARRKTLFLQTMLPMVLLANQEISKERTELFKLKTLINENTPLSSDQQSILLTLKKRYSVQNDVSEAEALTLLERRIDLVPPGLALAQAANESAWGTSRFSQLGNNLFGEWTFNPGTGIIPEDRPEGATYEVRRFATLYDSIRSYLRNLNTHSAYAEFRELRFEARKRGEKLNGLTLAAGLSKYSTRREEYVLDLQNLIRQNNLQRFAFAKLRQG
ncbi:glucosaminidase domain-containing protein [Geopsychrobacter electrodiphilus]|uniref:glucosaminidase domain-containing protein n=1 Tax=Geopsychrobacter electrodiphilus TaxID=225196 RepID=UPI0003624277|nr:glucosaminidase domain-containing protein [Geopsychrobacter electrodiphilus]